MNRFCKWLTSPFRVNVTGVNLSMDSPEIVAMCPWQGDVMIAMRDGTIYLARHDLNDNYPVFSQLTTLQGRR